MKKIHLYDGAPTSVQLEEQLEEVVNLFKDLLAVSKESGLSYVEINKALYLVDKGLYEEVISKRHGQSR